MLSVVLGSLRTRWATLVSTFVALALGVGLIAAIGQVLAGTLGAPPRNPQRYAAAPVVVSPIEEVRVTTHQGTKRQPLADPRGLPPEIAARLTAVGPAVVDRTFAARLASGSADQVGHPWSAAAFTPYRLVAGRKPVTGADIVVGDGTAPLGARVTVLTDGGAGRYTVVGLSTVTSFEQALFFADPEAARLSPRLDAVVSYAPAERVRQVIGDAAQVRTGQARRSLDPDLRRDGEALTAANALVGTTGGIAGFVSVFVVASAFSFALAQRRRELALLRLAGATPRRVRRLVLGEAAIVGALACVAGCLLGRAAGPRIAKWLVEQGFAPPWLAVPVSTGPLIVASSVGMAAALLGAWSSATRAGRIRAVEALREATADPRVMTPTRWICGLSILCGALAMLLLPVMEAPGDALKRKHSIPMVMLVLVAFALLAPILVPPAARLAGWPLTRLRGATGLLVRQGALAAARRSAAMAAPVLLTVGLAACLLGVTATVDRARADEARRQIGGDHLVVPDGAAGLNRAVVDGVRAVPGVDAAASYPTTVYDLEEREALIRRRAHAVDAEALPDLLRLPVVAGSVAELRDDTIIVDAEWGRQVGDTVGIWLGDGTPVTLRVVAVIRDGAGGNGAYLTRRYAGSALAERIQVRLRPGTDPATALADLRAVTGGLGATVVDAAVTPTRGRAGAAGLRILLGISLLYAGLSVAGTMLMAARDRRSELTLLRLAGATTGQVLRFVAAEALFAVVLGTVLAAAATALVLGGLWLALLRLIGPVPLVVPWQPVAGVAWAVAVVAVVASVLPSALDQRKR